MKKDICVLSLILCVTAAAPLLAGCGKDSGTGTVITTSPLPDSSFVSNEQEGDWTFALYKDYAEITGYGGSDPSPELPDVCGSLTVMSIGEHAFTASAETLISVSLPESVVIIGTRAFEGCYKLTSVEMPSVTTIGMYAFSGTALGVVSFPPCLSVIGRYAFSGSALSALTLPKTVEKIGDYAFEGCTSLTAVTAEEGITSLPARAFSGCTALTDVSLPQSIKKIGEYAFAYCTSLTEIHVGSSAVLAEGALYACSAELTIYAPSGSGGEKYATRYGIKFSEE